MAVVAKPRADGDDGIFLANHGSGRFSDAAIETRRWTLFTDQQLRQFRNSLVPGQSTGGYLADAEDIGAVLELALNNVSPIRRVAQIVRRPSKTKRFTIPATQTSELRGRILAPDQIAAATATDYSVKGLALQPRPLSTDILRVSRDLEEDAQVLKGSHVRLTGEALGRLTNHYATNGGGGIEPQGMVSGGVPVTITTASPTAIAIDELWALATSIPDRYRQPGSPSAAWMMHSLIEKYVRTQKDGMGQYLWKVAGLDQWPIVPNDDMPSSLTAGCVPVIFGDWQTYIVCDFGEMLVQILTEKYAEFAENGVLGIMYSDMGALPVGGLAALQMHA